MVWKESTNISSVGTSTKFGAADINKYSQLLKGNADVDTVDINSSWTQRSSKYFLRNPANTFSYTFIAAAIATNRNLTFPLLTGNDTLAVLAEAQTFSNKTLDSSCVVDNASLPSNAVTLTGTQTLTNKTITAPIISTILNTGTLTLPNTTDILVGRDTTDILTNKTLTLPVISAVSNSGTVTFPTGTLTLSTLTGTETLTNKTLTSPAINTPIVTGSGGTLTLPAGPDTLVGRATTDTLTNKTLTSPAINTPTVTGSGGTLTLPAGPDTLVGRATTDTLTTNT
jgi:hypothetical protein